MLEEKKSIPEIQVFRHRELAQYTELQQQAEDVDTMELDTARHAIRSDKEREAVIISYSRSIRLFRIAESISTV